MGRFYIVFPAVEEPGTETRSGGIINIQGDS